MKSLFFILFIISIVGCEKPDLIVSSNEDTQAAIDDRSWVTWDTCSQKPQDHPCNFKLKDQNGNEVELYDYYGKVIIIDLSTMWCGVCQTIAPIGKSLTEEYGEDNFVWLTILVEDESGLNPDPSDLQRWISEYGAAPPVLSGDRSLIDPSAETGYPVSGWPTLAIINKEMILTNGINGWSETYIRTWIENSL